MFNLEKSNVLGLVDFLEIVYKGKKVAISQSCAERLKKTRRFIDHLLKNNIKIYGLTTGFADLRDCAVRPEEAAELSENIITSHDAGIGKPLPPDVVLGAMVIRANSLAKGNSGFQLESLQTLVDMINARIIPLIPETGSLGASGDLAYLARLGRAMQGHDVPVYYKGVVVSAAEALKAEGIMLFHPKAKEGLALTNGTSFMASMITIAYQKEVRLLNNIFALLGLFLNSTQAIDASFYHCLHQSRNQKGQVFVAGIISEHFAGSPFINHAGVQDDYCVRCLPQIFGPRIEAILEQKTKISAELDAVTDNPLLFCGDEISGDVSSLRSVNFEGESWAVISGGNFHGEVSSTVADTICASNAKIALTLERHLTYMLNPFRNKNTLPTYLIDNEERKGLLSGYMITQYTVNSLAQKVCQLAAPVSVYNITSANESEDLVSYGATAGHKLLDQIDLMEQLITIYLTTAAQAYAIARQKKIDKGVRLPENLPAERLFKLIQDAHKESPYPCDQEFAKKYQINSGLLNSEQLFRVNDAFVCDAF